MTSDLTAGIVRILKPDGSTAGTGFVVSEEGLIATSAHVVQNADGSRPDGVDIVFHAIGAFARTKVEPKWWRPADAEDVAILQVEERLPRAVKSLLLGSSCGTSGHPFRTFGFPKAKGTDGMSGYGEIGDPTTEAGHPVIQLTGATEVTLGFSGAPVFNKTTRRVVGMITSILSPDRYARLRETAFVTPTETLRTICPVLHLSDLCPYQGLAPFDEDDAEFFFGREKLVTELVARLRGGARFLAVVGPSGSGKSSVMRAGLFPALRQGAVPGGEAWVPLAFRPGDDPFAALAATGLELGPDVDPHESVHVFLDDQPGKERVLFVVDQFEELFTLCPDPLRQLFVACLEALIESDLPVTIIVALRADFYEPFLQQKRLAARLAVGQVTVTAMGADELRVAVVRPAEKVGLRFEPGLVETIVEEAGHAQQPGQVHQSLPLLEAALARLWHERQEGMLTHEAYQRVGGVVGAISQWAEDVYSGLEEEDRQLAQRILTRLVFFGPQESMDLRQSRTFAELVTCSEEEEIVRRLVRRMTDARLLVTDRDVATGAETVEIVHDTLLWEWNWLAGWRHEERDFCRWRQRIEERRREWEDSGQSPGSLLRGGSLIEAKRWLAERPADLNPDERAYIRASAVRRKRFLVRLIGGLSLAVLLLAAGLHLWLGLSYYLSTSDTAGIVIRSGHPDLKLLPYFNQTVVVTDYSLRDLDDPIPISSERLRGTWLRRSGGYTYWGEQLFGHLAPTEAGLAYWRVGDVREAFGQLGEGMANDDLESVRVAGYLAILSEAAVEPAIDLLLVALQGGDESHEAALITLAVIRDTQPGPVTLQLESLATRLGATKDGETVALAEAIGVLSAHEQVASGLVAQDLLRACHEALGDEVQLAAIRALENLLYHRPDLLPALMPDLTGLVASREGQVRGALVALLAVPAPSDAAAQSLALEAVAEVLEDGQPENRAAAVATLGELLSNTSSVQSLKVLPSLLATSTDENSAVRLALAHALSDLPPEHVIGFDARKPVMVLMEGDPSYEVRYQATQALANLVTGDSSTAAIDALMEAIGDRHEYVRWGAVHALAEIELRGSSREGRIEQALRDALDDGSPDVRQEAAQSLLLIADRSQGDLAPALEEFLLALLSEDSRQEEDAKHLAQRFAPSATEAAASPEAAVIVARKLVPYASQADYLAAGKIIDFLVTMGENQPQILPEVVLALTDLLGTDEASDLADTALWSLRKQSSIHLEPVLAALLGRLNSALPEDRQTAARAMGWVVREERGLASQAATELLTKFTDPVADVRAELAFSLGLIGAYHAGAVQPALQTLLDCLDSEQPAVRIACAEALARISFGEEPPIDTLFPPLFATLQDSSPEIRQEAAKALSSLAESSDILPQSAVEPIRGALLAEGEPEIQLILALALGVIGGQHPAIADEVVAIAKAGLSDSNPDLRELAIWVLRGLGKQQPTAANQSLIVLSSALDDPDDLLRRAAISAIRDIGIGDAASAEAAVATLEVALLYPDRQNRWDAIANGIEPILDAQPAAATRAISLLRALLVDEANFEDDDYGLLRSKAWDALALAYATLAIEEPKILWPLIDSASAAERSAGREALVRMIAEHPESRSKVQGKLADLRCDGRPHVRQSAALATEMLALLERTEFVLAHPSQVKRWEEILEWLPSVGVGPALSLAEDKVREVSVER